jgi:peptide/nickel transport system permease protein
MIAFLIRRILFAIPTLLSVAVVVFVLGRLIPGDPALLLLGDSADPGALEELRRALALDRPFPVQFARWLMQVVTGDLGDSIQTGQPVLEMIADGFRVSALIVLIALALATLLAVPAGLVAAWRRDRRSDTAISAGAILLLSVPSFWLALLLLLLFGIHLHWLPVVGYVPFSEDVATASAYIVLPVATLALSEIGGLVRMTRASAIEVLSLDYVTHARAKGVPERRVLLRHVLPNAFAPTWTLIGLTLGHLLGGVAVIETVFTLPGLGRLLVDAVLGRDYPVMQGCLLFTGTIYVLVNLVVDLCYPLFDPRVTVQ